MNQLTSVANRIFFVGAFILAGFAVWEKLANLMGLTLLKGYYDPARLLELSAVTLLFVITLQLRELKKNLGSQSPG